MSAIVCLPLAGGGWAAFDREALREAITLAASLGLPASAAAPTETVSTTPERWLNSTEVGEVLGIHSTTVEQLAKSGAIPSARIGKALRFKLSVVEPAIAAART
jgi:excisionase family DNA binding protein